MPSTVRQMGAGAIRMEGGGMVTMMTRTTTTMHSNYINIKFTLYAYLIAAHVVPRMLHGDTLIHQIST